MTVARVCCISTLVLTAAFGAWGGPGLRGGSAPALAAARVRCERLPAQPRQGEPFFLRIRASEGVSDPECVWQGREWPFRRAGGDWVVALAASPDLKAGSHTVTVRGERDGDRFSQSESVRVAAVKFPIQRLKMARNTAALYSYPGADRDRAMIRASTRQETATPHWTHDFIIPSRGRQSSPYGVKRLRNGKAVGRHWGLDIAAPTGTPVRATNRGKITLSRFVKLTGHTVSIDHGMGVASIYMHLSARSVKEGEMVDRGELVGKIGATGVATGPHLHWAVYVHGTPLHPRFFTKISSLNLF